MPVLLVIDRGGSVKELATKTCDEESLYKKAGFKTPGDFEMHHVYGVGSYRIHLYGKTKGKAGQENKYDFPPPVDKVLFFGSCLLVNKRGEGEDAVVTDLPKKEWEVIYEKLFGGFEDLATTEAQDDEEDSIPEEDKRLLNDPKTKFTKQGYVKDDFIVDDDDDGDDESDDESDNDSEPVVRVPKKRAPRGSKVVGAATTPRKRVLKTPSVTTDDAVDSVAPKAKPRSKPGSRRPRKEPAPAVDDEPNVVPELENELSEEAYFA